MKMILLVWYQMAKFQVGIYVYVSLLVLSKEPIGMNFYETCLKSIPIVWLELLLLPITIGPIQSVGMVYVEEPYWKNPPSSQKMEMDSTNQKKWRVTLFFSLEREVV